MKKKVMAATITFFLLQPEILVGLQLDLERPIPCRKFSSCEQVALGTRVYFEFLSSSPEIVHGEDSLALIRSLKSSNALVLRVQPFKIAPSKCPALFADVDHVPDCIQTRVGICACRSDINALRSVGFRLDHRRVQRARI